MRLILVLGMHRSGTSCLTGLLENAGVVLGDVARKSAHNLKGNNENRAAMAVNDAVLAANGGTWARPPRGVVTWSETQLAEARALLREVLTNGKSSALKDPRCVFTHRGWRQAAEDLGAEVAAIATFRRPEKVVGSLRKRDPKLDEDRCYGIWRQYNEKVVEIHEEVPFPVVDFDLSADNYLSCVRRAFEALGLAEPSGDLFFTEDLRRQEKQASSHPELESLYQALKRMTS